MEHFLLKMDRPILLRIYGMNNFFSQSLYVDLLKATERDYFSTLDELKDCNFIGGGEVTAILESRELKSYSPVKYFFVKQLYDFFYITEINQSAEVQTYENEIFDFWNKGDFALQFFELTKKALAVDASKDLALGLEKKITAFFRVHISNDDIFQVPNDYSLVYEFGDQEKILNIPDKNIRLITSDCITEKLDSQKPFVFLPSHEMFDGKNLQKYTDKIQTSYQIISKLSPELYNALYTFTKYIIPTSEEEIVSHSSDELPGFSTINFVNRDDIDLLDDLLHENGHHFLNHFLNYRHLMDEDDEKIFYSPWRESQRAIRGIFHAFLTFYWAFYLYKLLVSQSDDYRNHSKCHFRFLEEYYMLCYSYDDLVFAHAEGKITDAGFKLIRMVFSEITAAKSLIEESKVFLKNNDKLHYQEIVSLQKKLQKQRKEGR